MFRFCGPHLGQEPYDLRCGSYVWVDASTAQERVSIGSSDDLRCRVQHLLATHSLIGRAVSHLPYTASLPSPPSLPRTPTVTLLLNETKQGSACTGQRVGEFVGPHFALNS
ncbi:hypothetical protein BHE74_00053228 [Ensete ventricosum]|nr:hypothetical protein BHE74_00053228 [Ensete ventricosum]RZS23315.1 hypothetical protein BHM03_00056221 [Ensete ventricosum]